jgi:hypothetical protein
VARGIKAQREQKEPVTVAAEQNEPHINYSKVVIATNRKRNRQCLPVELCGVYAANRSKSKPTSKQACRTNQARWRGGAEVAVSAPKAE